MDAEVPFNLVGRVRSPRSFANTHKTRYGAVRVQPATLGPTMQAPGPSSGRGRTRQGVDQRRGPGTARPLPRLTTEVQLAVPHGVGVLRRLLDQLRRQLHHPAASTPGAPHAGCLPPARSPGVPRARRQAAPIARRTRAQLNAQAEAIEKPRPRSQSPPRSWRIWTTPLVLVLFTGACLESGVPLIPDMCIR